MKTPTAASPDRSLSGTPCTVEFFDSQTMRNAHSAAVVQSTWFTPHGEGMVEVMLPSRKLIRLPQEYVYFS